MSFNGIHKHRRARVLFTTGNFGTGGKERQLSEIIHHLPQKHYSVHLFIKSQQAHYFKKIESKLDGFHSLEKQHFSPKDILILSRFIQNCRPDIVWSWATTTSYFCLLLKSLLMHRFIMIDGSIRSAPLLLSPYDQIKRILYHLFPVVVANSKAGLVSFDQSQRQNRFVIHNGFDFERVPSVTREVARKQLVFSLNSFIIVMVGSLTDQKDHQTFIHSINAVTKKYKNTIYYIVGDGYLRHKLEDLASRLSLQKNLFFLGQRSDIELIIRAADLLVLTSTHRMGEGIANVIIESMAIGTPVIAADCAGNREVIDNRRDGFLIPAEDHQSLADKILCLRQNPELLEDIAKEGIQKVIRNFDMKTVMVRVENILNYSLRKKAIIDV